MWLMNGTGVITSGSPGAPANDWQIVSVADFNGDGKADILWRHTSGTLSEWLLDGTTMTGSALVGSVPNSWHVQ
jgi:hypothetical protein